MPHLPTTRAQVGSTLPTIRRARTARPAQNPQNANPEKPTPTPSSVCCNSTKKPHYGRQRLARHLAQHGIHLSPQHHPTHPQTPRTSNQPSPQTAPTLLSAHWAWESQEPFTLIQADVKDIYDKGTLGTERWDHLRKHRLPRYQWTFLESRTRLRLLAFSREISHAARDGVFEFGSELAAAVRGADRNDYPDRLG
jgi:hypothetical protein